MDSILTSIKKLLGITEEYEQFDPDIVMHINAVFMILNQLGVGPEEGFSIEDKSTKWNEFLTDSILLGAVKPYMYAKVRLNFDPPSNSSIKEALVATVSELEWRLNSAAERKE